MRHQPAKLDEIDRKLLALLAEDSTQSYADLGEAIHLSAPAVHDRVKRLKRDGVIRATVAKIDGCKVGRTLLAFVLVNTKNLVSTKRLLTLANVPEIEEMHTVAGDSCVLLKVRVRETEGLEELLGKIQDIEGVDGTRSYIVMSTFVERGPDPYL
ncbi:Transcriptional regulator, AsnC family [plant metagenome]|uniref:Transcriptional regulator, AsnC family n=2 Tax=root TaxID=1 RepID=A0A1C3K707_9BURK|nr:Lrp/AsnC family transcriptional regulator [Orrella dioscoreae]SBT27286.1 Transcriptional regulator, AsnC family [Orrella dioscoreae]SOE50172.1 Transcriptional regulator, AsnC family [Orrella dioscoreae]